VEQWIALGHRYVRVRVLTAKKAIELFESATHRVEPIRRTKVPLAEQGRAISGDFQPVSHRLLAQRQPEFRRSVGAERAFGLELVAKALGIPAGHQARARRAAIRSAYVSICEANSAPRNAIDVWRWNVFAAVDPDIGVAKIVGHNQQDVRTL